MEEETLEETLYDRIGEADLNPIYKDGQVYQHTDVNNMLSILKTAVNENYYDIQKLENGTKSVGDAKKLDNAELSRYLSEQLQADDNKIPSSQQVKQYVDNRFKDFEPPIRGVDYWTEEDQQQITDEASDIVMENVIENISVAAFDVVDGKLIASYPKEPNGYEFRLNGNKLEVVIFNE